MPTDIIHRAIGIRGFVGQDVEILYGFECPTNDDGVAAVTIPPRFEEVVNPPLDEDDTGDWIEVTLGLYLAEELGSTEVKILIKATEWEAYVQTLTKVDDAPTPAPQISRAELLTGGQEEPNNDRT